MNLDIKAKDWIQEYPELKSLSEKFGLKDDKAFRFLYALYDTDGEYFKKYPSNFYERSKEAKEAFKYEKETSPALVTSFLLFLKNDIALRLASIEATIEECSEKIFKKIEIYEEPEKELKAIETKGKMHDLWDELLNRKAELLKEFFAGDDDANKNQAINFSSTESIVKRINRK